MYVRYLHGQGAVGSSEPSIVSNHSMEGRRSLNPKIRFLQLVRLTSSTTNIENLIITFLRSSDFRLLSDDFPEILTIEHRTHGKNLLRTWYFDVVLSDLVQRSVTLLSVYTFTCSAYLNHLDLIKSCLCPSMEKAPSLATGNKNIPRAWHDLGWFPVSSKI